MQWFGDPALAMAEVVPLVGMTPPCPFLKAAQQALDAAGRPWRMAMVTPSLDGLRAAIQAGIGLGCRTKAELALEPLLGAPLPSLPEIAFSVAERRRANSEIAQTLSRHLVGLPPQ